MALHWHYDSRGHMRDEHCAKKHCHVEIQMMGKQELMGIIP